MVDEKNRLLIPAEIRKSLNPKRDGEAFFLVIGSNRRPWLYPERYYEHLVFQRQQELAPKKSAIDFAHLNFAMASRIAWDKQWRVLLPEKTLRRTGTAKEVTLIGSGDHLELWNRSEWEARFEALFNQAAEQSATDEQQPPQPV